VRCALCRRSMLHQHGHRKQCEQNKREQAITHIGNYAEALCTVNGLRAIDSVAMRSANESSIDLHQYPPRLARRAHNLSSSLQLSICSLSTGRGTKAADSGIALPFDSCLPLS
jgi:hypothetical protein